MADSGILSKRGYTRLLRDLQAILEAGRAEAEAALAPGAGVGEPREPLEDLGAPVHGDSVIVVGNRDRNHPARLGGQAQPSARVACAVGRPAGYDRTGRFARRVRWRPGPVQRAPVNQVRTGR